MKKIINSEVMISEHRKLITWLHFDQKIWLNKLNFCNDELRIFQGRLEEVAADYTDVNVKIQVEQFQNKFFIQHDEMLRLRHDLKRFGSKIAEFEKQNSNAVDDITAKEHIMLEDRMNSFNEIYEDLKFDFKVFLERYL